GVDFGRAYDQLAVIALDEIPGIGFELMLDCVDEACRPIDPKALFSAEQSPQQVIKAGEVVHVSMRDEDVGDAQQFARRQTADVADVEEQRAALEDEIHIESGIAEGIIDGSGIKVTRHRSLAGGSRRRVGPAYAQVSCREAHKPLSRRIK